MAVLAAALWVLLSLEGPGPPDLRPVMPEADGVHPVTARLALRSAYAPGEGWLHKYPPLGLALFGVAAGRVGGGWLTDAGDVPNMDPAERRVLFWSHRDDIAAMIAAERAVSFWSMALAVAVLVALACAVAHACGAALWIAVPVSLLVGVLGWGRSYVVVYYAGTTNVDAMCVAASLLALCLAHRRFWGTAGVALGLAVAVKDPAFVLGPVLAIAAFRDGGLRRAALTTATALGTYALASGAVFAPGTWWTHVGYLFAGGVDAVDKIDVGDVTAWPGLLAHAGHLTVYALGLLGAAGGLVGLLLLLKRSPRSALLLIGVIVATLALFVLPVGFVYPRFLLVCWAALVVGAAVLLAVALTAMADVAGGTSRDARWTMMQLLLVVPVMLLVPLWLFWSEDAVPLTPGPMRAELSALLSGDDPRAVAAAATAQLPAGSTVVLYADLRNHGPPLDPDHLSVDVRGMVELEPNLAGHQRDPATRPDALLLMTFATQSPAGRPYEPRTPNVPGQELAGVWRVRSVFGELPTGEVGRSLAVQPLVTLLEPVR